MAEAAELLEAAFNTGSSGFEKLRLYMELGYDACALHQQRSLLHLVASIQWAASQKTAMTQVLIQRGANVDAQDDHGLTALMLCATNCSSLGVAKVLIQARADVNILSKAGRSALHYAVVLRSDQLLSMLLAANASVAIYDSVGALPLHCACHAGRLKVCTKQQLNLRGLCAQYDYYPNVDDSFNKARET
jgi:uncharacterized protein